MDDGLSMAMLDYRIGGILTHWAGCDMFPKRICAFNYKILQEQHHEFVVFLAENIFKMYVCNYLCPQEFTIGIRDQIYQICLITEKTHMPLQQLNSFCILHYIDIHRQAAGKEDQRVRRNLNWLGKSMDPSFRDLRKQRHITYNNINIALSLPPIIQYYCHILSGSLNKTLTHVHQGQYIPCD